MFKEKELQLKSGQRVAVPKDKTVWWLSMLVFLLILSGKATHFSISKLLDRGGHFIAFLKQLYPVDWSYVPKIIKPMQQTLAMSFLGTLFAAIVSVPFAYLSAENMNENKLSRLIVRFVLSIFRTIPMLIIALILTYIFDIGTFTGMLAIFLFTFSIITKMMYEQIELVDMGPFEAAISSGMNRFSAYWVAILPQIEGIYFSTVLYNLEMNVRSASILGYVGAGGIGIIMQEQIGFRQYGKLSAILIILLVTVIFIEQISRSIRKRLI